MRGKHKSLDKDLKKSIRWLESVAGVQKIVIGLSEACRHKYAPGHLRFKMDVDAGITLNGYSGNGVVNLFVRINPTSEREQVKLKIKAYFR
tara:strand:- start:16427 stop:16699 length:273 start_codon:yes stop_codon:yes gene_type:complete